jgi:xanthine dehydrogenase molybdopterin-binding subunit B
LTTEELVFDEQGRLLTHAPSTYKIPVASDVPADFRVALFDGSNREETIYPTFSRWKPVPAQICSNWRILTSQ